MADDEIRKKTKPLKLGSWVHAVGGADYVANVANAAERQKLIEELRRSLKELIIHSATCEAPLRDSAFDGEDNPLLKLIKAIESIFEHEVLEDISGHLGFWSCIEQLERLLPSKGHIHIIRGLIRVNTERGKGRAWVRLALNEKSLSDCLRALIDDHAFMRKWYKESALLRHPEDSPLLISLLRGLSAIDFDLSLDEPWLDREIEQRKIRSRKKKSRRGVRRVAVVEEAGQPDERNPSDLNEDVDSRNNDLNEAETRDVWKGGLLVDIYRNEADTEVVSQDPFKEQTSSVLAMQNEIHSISDNCSLNSNALLAVNEVCRVDPMSDGSSETKNVDGHDDSQDPEILLLQEQLRLIEEKLQQNHRVRSLQQSISSRLGLSPSQNGNGEAVLSEPKPLSTGECLIDVPNDADDVGTDRAFGSETGNRDDFSSQHDIPNVQRRSGERENGKANEKTYWNAHAFEDINDDDNQNGGDINNGNANSHASCDDLDHSLQSSAIPVRWTKDDGQVDMENHTTQPDSNPNDLNGMTQPEAAWGDHSGEEWVFLPRPDAWGESDTPQIRASITQNQDPLVTETKSTISITSATESPGMDDEIRLANGEGTSISSLNGGGEQQKQTPVYNGEDVDYPDLQLEDLDADLDLSHLDLYFTSQEQREDSKGINLDQCNVQILVVPVDRRDIFSASVGAHTLLRDGEGYNTGVSNWQPPKKQLYFHIPKPSVPSMQHYMCASCGAKLTTTARYCEYMGNWHCANSCHANQRAIIPARLLIEGDLTRYPVCKFAWSLLAEIADLPTMDISALNPQLYRLSPALNQIRGVRQQLWYMKDYILTCREKLRVMTTIDDNLKYIIRDVDTYSLTHLIAAVSGTFLSELRRMSNIFLTHIAKCELCKAKGSYCEICSAPEAIYSFQRSARQCTVCHALFHSACFRPGHCPKCARLAKRKANS